MHTEIEGHERALDGDADREAPAGADRLAPLARPALLDFPDRAQRAGPKEA